MDYITKARGHMLTNEPYEISYEVIGMMYMENLKDEEECKQVTQSSNRGESYYADDNRPGEGKVSNIRLAAYKETLYRDPKITGFMIKYPHGTR